MLQNAHDIRLYNAFYVAFYWGFLLIGLPRTPFHAALTLNVSPNQGLAAW